MEEIVTTNIILKELREFREDNNKKWEQNEKRWEENDKKWEQNNKRWEQNDKRWEENDKNIKMIDNRVKTVEDKEESNKYELFRIVNVIGETMKDEFEKLNKKLDIKIKKIDAMLAENELQQEEMKQKIKENASKINLCNIRIEKIENWKDEFTTGTSLLV